MPAAEDPLPPVTARRMRLFPPAAAPHCTNPAEHEAWCPHPAADPMVTWRTEDGCTGRFCTACDTQYQVKSWPDLTERIPGPVRGLDALAVLRAGGTAR